MQLTSFLLCLSIAAASSLVTMTLATQGQEKAAPQDKAKKGEVADMQDVTRAFEDAAKPGEQHKRLQELVGEWDIETELLMGPAPAKSKGSSEFKSILGGRFVVQTSKGSLMGVAHEGMQVLGYDNIAKKYVSVRMDTRSTGMHECSGTADASGKAITLTGSIKDAVTPEGRPYRVLVRHDTKDSFTIEVFDTIQGKETAVVKSIYSRKK